MCKKGYPSMIKNFTVILLIVVFIFPLTIHPVHAETVLSKAVKVTFNGNDWTYPLALDDQGNLWATSISSRAYRKNLFPFRANFVKLESMGKVLDVSARFVVKEDGTVWAIEYEEAKEEDKDKWGLYTPTYVNQLPGLERIVKINGSGRSLFALDRDGKLWYAESFWRTHKSIPNPDGTYTVEREPMLVKNIDHIKDISNGIILKEDGTVWTWKCPRVCDFDKTIRTTSPEKIDGLENIVKAAGNWLGGFALKKDGTIWTWGSKSSSWDIKILGSTNSDGTPSQVEGLFDIVDFSYTNLFMVVKKDGTVWCMGETSPGLTYGSVNEKYPTLTRMEGITDASAVFQFSQPETMGIIKKDGSMLMWGEDYFGFFGTSMNYQPKPTRVELRSDTE